MDSNFKNKVCVYAICKNESQFVERWYNSMKEADCVVVLDTGSTDDTVEKLKNLGAKVEQKIFDQFRFDDARNESIKLVPENCNILVSTDLDEYFDPGWADELRKKWSYENTKRCNYTYYLFDGHKIIYNKIHGKQWHWIYPVHEMIVKDSDGTQDLENGEIIDLCDKVILHHEPDFSKSRNDYIELLKLRAKEDPSDFLGLYYLANEYEDRTEIQEAIDVLKNGLTLTSEFYKFIFMVRIGILYEKINDNDNALFYLTESVKICKEFRFVFLHIAKLLFNYKQDYEQSYKYLIQGLKYSFFHEFWFEKNEGWGGDYYDLLSMSAFYSGRKIASLAAAVIASAKEPNDERIKENVDIILNQITDKDFFEYEK